MQTLASRQSVTVGSRIQGRCPSLGSIHYGTVSKVHEPAPFAACHADVTIAEDGTRREMPVIFEGFAPRFAVGDRVYLRGEPGPLGTVIAASSQTVDVEFNDGTGYHGTDSGVQHASGAA